MGRPRRAGQSPRAAIRSWRRPEVSPRVAVGPGARAAPGVLQRQRFLLVQQQPGAELRQRRRMPPLMIDRQPQRDLAPQIPRHTLHRLLITDPGPVLQQHHPRQQRRRDRRSPLPGRVALCEVLITHDPITVLRQQRDKRPLRQRPHHHRRIEHPHLSRLSREHAGKVINPPDGTRLFHGSSSWHRPPGRVRPGARQATWMRGPFPDRTVNA